MCASASGIFGATTERGRIDVNTLGNDLIEAMSEAVAYMSGNPGNTVTHEVRVPEDADAAEQRNEREAET